MLTGVTQMYLESEMALDGSLFDPEYRLFLSFVLEHDYYGIPIEYITEVKSWADVKIRPLVKAPDFLLGVFNLRGNIVPSWTFARNGIASTKSSTPARPSLFWPFKSTCGRWWSTASRKWRA